MQGGWQSNWVCCRGEVQKKTQSDWRNKKLETMDDLWVKHKTREKIETIRGDSHPYMPGLEFFLVPQNKQTATVSMPWNNIWGTGLYSWAKILLVIWNWIVTTTWLNAKNWFELWHWKLDWCQIDSLWWGVFYARNEMRSRHFFTAWFSLHDQFLLTHKECNNNKLLLLL